MTATTTGQNQNRTYLTGLANLNTNISEQPQAGEAVLASFSPGRTNAQGIRAGKAGRSFVAVLLRALSAFAV